ncbi:MAG: hypothetical protein PVH84_00965 [Candidatus Aminicenantes bacterium]|jgi:hypothetical protein
MKIHFLKLFVLVVVISTVAFGCGGSKEQSSTAETADESGAPKAENSKEMSPSELGQEIADLYAKAMTELTDMLKDKPAVDEVKTKVEDLKEVYVKKLVEYGRKREAFDAPGRASVDSQIRMKASSMYKQPVWTSYNDIQQHYFQDRDFHKIIMSFNIITQYANFDLLKKQEPDEAMRLGIQ